jgi:hypothetical protein
MCALSYTFSTVLFWFCLILPGSCLAGTAAFSADGSQVFVLDWEGVVDFDLKSHKAARIPLNVGGEIGRVSYSPDGLLVVTDTALWRMPYQTKQPSRVCNAPEGMILREVAYDPKSKALLLSCFSKSHNSDGWSLFLLKSGVKTPARVFNRRLRYLETLIFDRDGNVFFTSEGDIWKGWIDWSEQFPSLTAFRFAPLATRESQNTSPAQMGALELALNGDRIYACIRRMGGTGDGKTVSLQLPVVPPPREVNKENAKEKEMPFELEEFITMYKAALSSLRIYGDNAGVSGFLCSSPDEQGVFFSTIREEGIGTQLNAREFWLSVNGGDPKRIEFDISDAK